MRRLDGEVHVHYSQLYVESDPESVGPDMEEAFAGQSAGLCGAAVPGALWLMTGLHTGNVGFTAEVRGQAPPLDTAWEDVVEVSFRPVSAQSWLMQWAGEACWELDLEEIDYRVRYCAQGMDQAHQKDTRLDDEPLLDRYLLQFWPAPPEPDRVVRQTAEIAAYWHDYARRQPSPTPE
ncbi:hypothetical protein B7C42_01951 [Nocardia cerradoensis]|uniref:Uncharacterized protein n=1 Tax=Nocardia cerradoensis TaxID=85688 RepID=A0A231H9Y2_9NOCA|nr:hypothetical protein [Nocardia cerradoensis]OXR45659.1 hypothetical protein B7C42_01951 [Nocardia cerradoensis]